jgi:hypothetical protein
MCAQSRARSAEGSAPGNISVQQHPVQPTASQPAHNAQTGEKSLNPNPANYCAISGFKYAEYCGTGESSAGSTGIEEPPRGSRTTKKEEFTGLMVTWCLGTPSPDLRCFWNDY